MIGQNFNNPIGTTGNNQFKTIQLVKSAFKQYYFKQYDCIEIPDKIREREFGYMLFGESVPFANGGMIRHLSFKTIGELVAVLIKEVPADAFCSNAYYGFPDYPMQEKSWKGADLIFDIDGKDIVLPCIPSHSYLICGTCRDAISVEHVGAATDQGNASVSCRSCKVGKVNLVSLPCTKCMDASKKEVIRLNQLLAEEFGVEENDIRIYFSGNNGFHLHLTDIRFIPLESQARSDIVGYLTGVGLMTETLGVRRVAGDKGFTVKLPNRDLSFGWRKKIAKKMKISGVSTYSLEKKIQQYGGYAGFKTEVDLIAKEIGLKIDRQVTMDTHRVFRMPGTLNSKSGLAKVKCDNIATFDPFSSACLLDDRNTTIRVKADVRLRLKGRSFNMTKGESGISLPIYAAVYLACKGLAECS